jgi:transposase
MMIMDFHPSWQQIAWLETETGERGEQKLVHAEGQARQFYQQVPAPALIGMEATANSRWFIELVEDLGHQIWVGDAAQIRASYVRKQKTDKRDAAHLLKQMVEGRFPRLWTPDREQRDLRQLVLHRHKLVMIRSRVKNELQHLSLNQGMQRQRRLWSEHGLQLLRELPLKPWASCRREDLLVLLAMFDQQIGELDRAVQAAADEHPQAKLLMTQPGVGPNTALAFVLTIGEVSRFRRGKQIANYLGLIPREEKKRLLPRHREPDASSSLDTADWCAAHKSQLKFASRGPAEACDGGHGAVVMNPGAGFRIGKAADFRTRAVVPADQEARDGELCRLSGEIFACGGSSGNVLAGFLSRMIGSQRLARRLDGGQ